VVTRKTERRKVYLVDSSVDEDEQRFDELVDEIEGYPGWRIIPDVEVTERGLRLRRLVIERDPSKPMRPEDSGITTRMLRDIHTGPLIASVRVAAAQHKALFGSAPDLSVGRRVGRAGRDDLYYAQWAAAYVAALAQSPHPVDDLAAQHNRSASQIRNLVHACRKRKMLTAAPPGRAGGELTARAIELLREH
jgi:hypothetical protein